MMLSVVQIHNALDAYNNAYVLMDSVAAVWAEQLIVLRMESALRLERRETIEHPAPLKSPCYGSTKGPILSTYERSVRFMNSESGNVLCAAEKTSSLSDQY